MGLWVILGFVILVGALLYYIFSSSKSTDSVTVIPDLQSGF
jgi:beta-lactam-binding protein with PASTA domain